MIDNLFSELLIRSGGGGDIIPVLEEAVMWDVRIVIVH